MWWSRAEGRCWGRGQDRAWGFWSGGIWDRLLLGSSDCWGWVSWTETIKEPRTGRHQPSSSISISSGWFAQGRWEVRLLHRTLSRSWLLVWGTQVSGALLGQDNLSPTQVKHLWHACSKGHLPQTRDRWQEHFLQEDLTGSKRVAKGSP